MTLSQPKSLHVFPPATRLQLLELIVEQARDGVLIAAVSPEADGPVRVIYGNTAFCAMTGFTPDEITGKPLAFLSGPTTEPAALQQIMDASRHATPLSLELHEYRKDHSSFWAEVSVVPITDDETGDRYLAIMQSDITARKLQQRKNDLITAELSRSNRALQEFASVASHDLQEPLRKIKAFGDVLAEQSGEALDDEGRDYLGRMLNAAGRMQTLISDLLTFARLTTQAQPFVAVDLSRVIRDVLVDLEAQLSRTQGTVTVGELTPIAADPRQMRMLFQNLISNALKFARPDVPPVVTIAGHTIPRPTTMLPDTSRLWYEITISDNGIGFDPRFTEKIFAIFQRLHRRQEYEGTGIGLAICREIAAFHHGTLTATSTPGAGAIFTFQLPLQHPQQENAR